MVKRKTSSDPRQASRPIAPDDTQWPIEVGKLMKTPVFHPTEEEFSDFYAYAQKLDRLVGHVGVCKVIPPAGWKPRAHDVYTLKDSTEELEDAVTVKKPIRQNAIGGKGLYLNLHEEKRSMTLKAFKKACQEKPFQPPVDVTSENLSDEDLEVCERRFWKNVLFNPPMYGADCPSPQGFRKDGREGLFDPDVCGSWDLAKLPSLLNFGLKKRVPGVNTSFIYVGMYRAAFAWHCEDMDLHSINYLHWGAPKTWYTVPATHGKKLEELARKHFPVQAKECSEFLRHKTNIIEPGILLKAGIPLTRTVQKAGEFIINFPGAYHSGFNNGYNCAESCNFATEYWIPFAVQAKPCSCVSKQNSVRIDVDAILNKVKDVKVKGEQWVQCESCQKWRLLPPYMMHLLQDDDPFTCNLIEGMTCSKKEMRGAWAGEEGQWEVDGKVQLGLDPGKEEWVLCEQCKKWRRIPEGVALDADAVFVCSVLEGWTCEKEEEVWEDAEDGQGWQIMDVDARRSKYGEWTAADEEKLRVKFMKEELAAYGVGDQRITECCDDRVKLETLLEKTASDVAQSWDELTRRWPTIAPPLRPAGAGIVASSPARTAAASVAQRLWFMDVEAEEAREQGRKRKEQEKRKRKMEDIRAEEARAIQEYTEEIQSGLKAVQAPSSQSPSRASSPALTARDRCCASPIPRCASPSPIPRPGSPMPIPRPGSPMSHGSAKRLRFHQQMVTVICFGTAQLDRRLCKDDRSWGQLQKLLSPAARDVVPIQLSSTRTISPSPPSSAQSVHHSPHALSTPAVADILGPSHQPLMAAGHVAAMSMQTGPGSAGGGVSVFVRALASGGREEQMLMDYLARLEEARGANTSAPCAVLLRGVEVAVGSWQEEGAEEAARGRGEGWLARVAMKRVLSMVEGALREKSEAAVKLEPGDDVKVEVKREGLDGGDVDADLLQGGRGAMAAVEGVTKQFWHRAAKGESVQVPQRRGAGGEGKEGYRGVVIVHAPSLPPRSPQTKPKLNPISAYPTPASLTPSALPPSPTSASSVRSAGAFHGSLSGPAPPSSAHYLPLSPPSFSLTGGVTATAPWPSFGGMPPQHPQPMHPQPAQMPPQDPREFQLQ